ncbi:MAG: hypoxanthine phosphoribosyltransferase [Myxococcota bacterium]|jgi:hypoxanthine phosphoribosyltransferase|nr:hypoxanthine phosphoribosyltransferase [Myxococcota bacterium]
MSTTVDEMWGAPLEVLLTAQQLQARVTELGEQITRDYADKELVLVGVLKGSFLFLADLARAIRLPLAIDFLGLSSYGGRTKTTGVVRITSDLTFPIEGKDVLVVEDIVDTGLTMSYLIANLQTRLPSSVRVCSLLYKPENNLIPCQIDYLGFTIPNRFVVGYGLDYNHLYRNLPYLGVPAADAHP